MAVVSRSAKAFLERSGLRPTLRPPLPTAAPGSLPVLRSKAEAPRPWPELLGTTQGDPPPDRGPSRPWPHG